jgi:hypothetical protein
MKYFDDVFKNTYNVSVEQSFDYWLKNIYKGDKNES